MKRMIYQILFLLVPVFLASNSQLLAQQKKISIQGRTESNRISYAVDQVKKAATGKKYLIAQSSSVNKSVDDDLVVTIFSDSADIVKVSGEQNFKRPLHYGWQCYSIRIKNSGKQKLVYVLAGDETGALYGALDIAEAIRNNSIGSIADSDNKPYLDRRGIKFNIPLDLRTPSYTDPSDAAQQNIPNVWDKKFWEILS